MVSWEALGLKEGHFEERNVSYGRWRPLKFTLPVIAGTRAPRYWIASQGMRRQLACKVPQVYASVTAGFAIM